LKLRVYPPRCTELVKHQVNAAQLQCLDQAGQMATVSTDVEVEGARMVRTAEAGHIDGYDATKPSSISRDVLPVFHRARVSVDEDRRDVAIERTRFVHCRAHSVHSQVADGHHVYLTALLELPAYRRIAGVEQRLNAVTLP
jgi:hypothetical protein